MLDRERATAAAAAHGPRGMDQLGGSISPEDSADARFAARLDRSRESWERICARKDDDNANLARQLAECRRQNETYRKIIRGFEIHREAECTRG